jgi:diguanylate cyclase (GGDEF)-like protein/PAS domain S-box-containing protein
MKTALLRAVATALDPLEIAFCAFDRQHRTLAWNSTFLDFFPEHRGFVHEGEPYAENLRRFYLGRLSPDELPLIERYIADGLERHQSQRRPYEFEHRGIRVRVSSVELGGYGRVRFWRRVDTAAVAGVSAPAAASTTHPTRTPYRYFNADTTQVLERIADGVLVVDPADRVLWANRSFLRQYGLFSVEQARGQSFEALYRAAWADTPQAPDFQRSLATLRENRRFPGAPFELALPGAQWLRVTEQRGDAVDGRGYFVHVDITPLKRQQQALSTAEARARESEARYRLLAEYSSDITVALVHDRVTYVSPAVTKVLGWRPQDIEGRRLAEFCHPDDAAGIDAVMQRLSGVPEADYRARARHASGGHVWVEARARLTPAPDGAQQAPLLVINLRSITARKAVEDELDIARRRLEELAVKDGLTGLANRRRFDEAWEVEFRRAQREARPLSLLMIDIDNFKALNDAHGHPAGDRVLRRLAGLLAGFAQRAGDVAARYGGEEFALLLPHADGAQAEATAEQLRAAVAAPGTLTSDIIPITVSIGLATTDNSRLTALPESLVQLADEALYAAKHAGKNRVRAAHDPAAPAERRGHPAAADHTGPALTGPAPGDTLH